MKGGFTQDQIAVVGETEQLLHEARYDPQFAEMMRARGSIINPPNLKIYRISQF